MRALAVRHSGYPPLKQQQVANKPWDLTTTNAWKYVTTPEDVLDSSTPLLPGALGQLRAAAQSLPNECPMRTSGSGKEWQMDNTLST